MWSTHATESYSGINKNKMVPSAATWIQPEIIMGFPGGSDGKEPGPSAGDPGSIPGLGQSPGEGNGNPLQYSRLENSMNRVAWQATVQGVKKSQLLED